MAESFTKLFSSITDSSIWAEDHPTVRLWITLLAMADRNGYVGASIPGLAGRARITVTETEAALAKFLAPDPYSRSKEFDGRRIEVADRGWVLLNHARYREQRDGEARREWDRNRKRERRDRDRTAVDSGGMSASGAESPPRSAHAEADADSELGAGAPPLGDRAVLSSDPSGASESVAAPAQRPPRRSRRPASGPQLALHGAEAEPGGARPPEPKTRGTAQKGAHPEVVAAYARAYEQAHGHQPTIGAKQAAQVATLLRSHAAGEIVRRLGILADRRGPAWLYRDGGAWDLNTLVAHFDKLAVPAVAERREAATGGVSFFLDQAKQETER
jgi:hypothetical protein